MNREKAAAIKKRIADCSSTEECAGKKPAEVTFQERKARIGRERENVQAMRRRIQSEAADVLILSPNTDKIEVGAFRWQEPTLAKEFHDNQKGIVKSIVSAKKSLEGELNTTGESYQKEKNTLSEKFRIMAEYVAV